MNLLSKPLLQRLRSTPTVATPPRPPASAPGPAVVRTDSRSWQAGRWPLSLAAPAFGSSAMWLFLTVWLPAAQGLRPPGTEAAVSSAATEPAQAVSAWPAPVVAAEGTAPAEPSPTF